MKYHKMQIKSNISNLELNSNIKTLKLSAEANVFYQLLETCVLVLMLC